MRVTHTYVELEISQSAYDEISGKLRAAGYGHAFMRDGAIDMHGIAVKPDGLGDMDTVVMPDGSIKGKPLPDLRGIR